MQSLNCLALLQYWTLILQWWNGQHQALASSIGHLQMVLSSTNLLRALTLYIQQQEGVPPDSVFPQVFFHRIFHSILFQCSRIIHMYHAYDQLIVIFWIYSTIPCPPNNSQSSSLFLSLHHKLFSNSGLRFFLVFSFHILLDFLLMAQ